MPIPQEIIDSLAVENLKTVGGFIAAQTNLAFANSVSNQQTVNGIMAAGLGKIVKDLTETDVSESLGLVALGQQSMKGAQTTPPPTP